MSARLSLFVFTLFLLALGLLLILSAKLLSDRYNAWTTKFREGNVRLLPPTREGQAQNTRIFAWLMRAAGAWLTLLSLLMLFKIFAA